MKKLFIIICTTLSLTAPVKAKADLFGGDVAVLMQILAEAILQYEKLKAILNTGNDTLDLLRDIHRGIDDSLGLFRTFPPIPEPGVYNNWKKIEEAIRQLREIYGVVVTSPQSRIETDTDQSVAEAVSLNNTLYEYSRNIDEIGDQVRRFGDKVSPAWAPKLSAQTMGVVLQVLNQSLRAQATGLKLQAQSVAIQNQKDKESTKDILSNSETLQKSMNEERAPFEIPRF